MSKKGFDKTRAGRGSDMSDLKKDKTARRGPRREDVPGLRPKQRLAEHRVLAGRNEAVAAVGAWVESGEPWQQHPAVLASATEEQLVELCREKEESLRRFQAEVRKRVAQQARVRRKQQLQKSCEMAEHEARVLWQSSDAPQGFRPNRSLFLQGELAIGSPVSQRVRVQTLRSTDGESGTVNGRRHGHQVKYIHPAPNHLCICTSGQLFDSCFPVQELSSCHQLSGGREDDEILLYGQHDKPHDLQYHRGEDGTSRNIPMYESLLREPDPAGPSPSSSTDYRATQVLWPYEDQEELKRQRQSQFLMNRRLFMDIERAQVQELHRHRKHLKQIERIKADKERWRLEEERRMQRQQELEEDTQETAKREWQILERLRLEKQEMLEDMERKERAQKDLEDARFVEALRVQMKEKMMQEKVDLPPLCCCGESFWDSHPDTCANNCIFYNNPKAYTQALQSVLLSSDLREGNLSYRASARRIASVHAHSPRTQHHIY
ncbi:coiled-coil domain-containing protein 15 [Arapaima gigas]